MLINNMRGSLLDNESLANYTTWRVGGKARYVYKPKDLADLVCVLPQLPRHLNVLWLGLGSNTLIRDGGFDGVVIVTQGAIRELSVLDNGQVYVEAGTSCATMARFCARKSLGSAEFWAGIPGTMGGALRMNAGCFNGETWDNLVAVQTLSRDGVLRWRDKSSFLVSYRQVSGLDEGEWFVGACFSLPQGDKDDSLSKIKALLARRADTQPTGEYNCGSVFRNPEGDFAARLIESCGLKGHAIGDAYISQKHANFITNKGTAAASDIESLIELVMNKVRQQIGIDLNHEVQIVGQKGVSDEQQ